MKAIVKQLEDDLQKYKIKETSIETVFIGGGTPSTVEPEDYAAFFKLLRPYLKDNCEITTEANPNSATKHWIEGMKNHGINRISFGTQSFNEEKLKFLNRAHSGEDTKIAVQTASDLGIKNLSIDLIYATSMDSRELLQEDLKQALALPINHLSAYALIIEEGTEFFKKPQVAKENFDDTVWLMQELEKAGLKQYEISNFGSYESQHNKGYWEYKNYLGIGAGAVGCVDATRTYTHSDVDAYIKDPLFKELEHLSDEDQLSEKILLAMRSNVGFDVDLLGTEQLKRLKILLDEKKLYEKAGRIYNENYLLADEIALFLLG